ncbi:helicase-related protein [Nocardioides koreensis]
MTDALGADLMGGPQDAQLDEAPMDRFVLGILHPQDGLTMEEADSETDSAESSSAADGVFDPAVALSRMRYPSSMGFTFAVDPRASPELVIEAAAARYLPDSQTDGAWLRNESISEPIRIATGAVGPLKTPLAAGLELYTVVRAPMDGVCSVTVVLVNTQGSPPTGRRDEYCWFQPRLSVSVDTGRFVPRHSSPSQGLDDADLASYSLLYREVEDLAVGHGCAVAWDHAAQTVTRLEATFLPWYDVKLAEPAGGGGIRITMRELAEGGKLDALHALVSDYRRWIADRRAELSGLAAEHLPTAERHLADAQEAAARIERGLRLLDQDAHAAAAFRLMNEAMSLQRSRQDAQRGQGQREQVWRPFQMAFILLNLEGLTNADCPDRELADLLWFPTGGGKTEAYLGLIAYAILLRRLRDPRDGGVSVLMRYTLRLLTIQQFERAAGLICALESLRRLRLRDSEPISLGLWVGQGATPNTIADARAALRAIDRGERSKNGNPVQLLRCPVCGTGLKVSDYRILRGPDRLEVRCGNAACEFAPGLPVHLVDEDVYRVRPSLVIGTVDKFAMMAWREEVRNLFGRDCADSPPDLIVQDELHLISGPLGTMVGLYEAAVDLACTGANRPKVVASTATIRRASKQVNAVFDREARQFPPPGLTAADSYFSVEAPSHSKGTRRYLGVLAPSVSHTTLMVRTYAVLLQSAKDLPEDDEVRDAYWTLLGYFNSLRVLGGAFMQVFDDVPDRIKVVAGRAGTEPREAMNVGELTSRVDSADIPRELEILGTSLPSEETQDVVLATNMISVGVDVDRLGLMAVMGQPQTTAEYIQSTSRVGRQHPGLVVVIYNAARSRDLSHYENFASYHRALYRQVEATGATPFAARARDRGLHGMLVAMTRLMIDGLAGDPRAVQLPNHRAEVEGLCDGIVERCRNISPHEAEKVRAQLDALIDSWADACDAPSLKYAGWRSPDGALLQEAGQVLRDQTAGFPVDAPAWPTMLSLRDVDVSSSLFLVPPTVKDR